MPTRKRIWMSPCPGVGLRGVATKWRFGWSVVCRDFTGKCFREWAPYLGERFVDRDAKPIPKDLSRPKTYRTRWGDRYI